MSKEPLRRYTELPYLLYMLEHKKLTLIAPALWEDKNDSRYLEEFRQKGSWESVLTLCLTGTKNTFHHWKIFAPGPSGVRIEFRRNKFLAWAKDAGLAPREIEYCGKGAVKRFSTADWPYLKRNAFKDECEIRLIFATKDKVRAKDFDFDLDLVKEIVLSPWLHERVAPAVESTIRRLIPKRCAIRIRKTEFLDNKEWQALVNC